MRARERLEALERAARELSTAGHIGRSRDGSVSVVVDGAGQVIDLRLPASLVGVSADRLSASIVEAAADAERGAHASREALVDGLRDELRRS